MYNLTVDTAHTFFVGDRQWLVHNTDPLCGLSDILENYNAEQQAEIQGLMAKWGNTNFGNDVDAVAYHFARHGDTDLLRYLRQADGFSTKGASRIAVELRDGSQGFRYEKFKPDGTSTFIIKDGNGKIISFGQNPK